MADAKGLPNLASLAGLILDARLADLRKAAAAREASLAALAALARAPSAAADLSPLVLARAAVAYESWADARRAEINPRLARQTAAWLQAQAAARVAFGRAEALRVIAARATLRR